VARPTSGVRIERLTDRPSTSTRKPPSAVGSTSISTTSATEGVSPIFSPTDFLSAFSFRSSPFVSAASLMPAAAFGAAFRGARVFFLGVPHEQDCRNTRFAEEHIQRLRLIAVNYREPRCAAVVLVVGMIGQKDIPGLWEIDGVRSAGVSGRRVDGTPILFDKRNRNAGNRRSNAAACLTHVGMAQVARATSEQYD